MLTLPLPTKRAPVSGVDGSISTESATDLLVRPAGVEPATLGLEVWSPAPPERVTVTPGSNEHKDNRSAPGAVACAASRLTAGRSWRGGDGRRIGVVGDPRRSPG